MRNLTKCILLFAVFMAAMTAAAGPASDHAPLRVVADIPLSGPAVRFDYQNLDVTHHRLYISHMNASQLIVFDTQKRSIIATLDGFPSVHGVIAVPQLNRVYASATGEHKVVVVNAGTLQIIAQPGPIDHPDGLAYAPGVKRVFVSDEFGDADVVIAAATNKIVRRIPLGGDAGNTVYDPGSGKILVAVGSKDELAVIDPATEKIIGHYPLPGIERAHGVALDVKGRLAFVAGEHNQKVAVFDLTSKQVLGLYPVGPDPDVLAYDPGNKMLYVAAESGQVTVFQEKGKSLVSKGSIDMAHAHTVCVDPQTHLVYFPLQDVDGHPVLRIMTLN